MARHSLDRPQRGMSLVELMVATVISLVGVLIIFQVFAVNEDVRRATTTGGDEQTSGLVALMTIERELRHAGFGINDFNLAGCTMKTYDSARTPATVPDFPLAPVWIVPNTGTTPDVIRVIYGGIMHMPGPVQFGATEMSGPKDDVYLKFRYSIEAGDVVVVGQGVVGDPDQADCTMMEVTDQFVDGKTSLKHDVGSYTYTHGTEVLTKVARFNDPNGLHAPVKADPNRQLYSGSEKAKVLNLGPFPVYTEMTVCNDDESNADCPAALKRNQLVMQNLWGQMAQQNPVAEQIVHLKAEYGMDDGKDCNKTVVRDNCVENDDRVDRFFHPDHDFVPPANFWKQVRSVRVAIVTRSLTPDRTPCSATPDFDSDAYPVRWARGPNAPQGERIDVRTRADWQCFRYHVYETTIPVRNMLWRSE